MDILRLSNAIINRKPEPPIELENIAEITNPSTGFNPYQQQVQQTESSSTHELTEADSLLDEGVEFPEGGLKAYLAVFGSFMGLIPGFGLMNSIGAIESYVSSHQLQGVSASTVSWIFSIYMFVAFALGIFSGAFFDRNGAFAPLIIGTVFFCGGLFIIGSSTTVYQFVLGFSIIGGFGNGMLMTPLIGVISHYFNKKRAIYTSIASIGGSIGGICFPLLLKKLYSTVGFSWAMRILSFICLFCLSFSILFSRERLKEEHEEIKTTKQFLKIYIFNIFDINSFKDYRFLFCSLGCAFAETALVIALTYFPSYALRRGFNETNSYYLITVLNTTGILGRYIPAYMADKYIGRFNVVIITLFMNAVVCLGVWLPFGHDLKVLYAFAALYGFFSGSMQSLVPVCAGQISKTSEFGKKYSTMYMIVSLTMLTFIPIGGVIIGDGSVENYNYFIVYCGFMAILAGVFYLISRTFCIGLKLRYKF